MCYPFILNPQDAGESDVIGYGVKAENQFITVRVSLYMVSDILYVRVPPPMKGSQTLHLAGGVST